MIDYNEIVYFDCETTGLPPKDAKWDIDFEQFPRICQLSWIYNGHEHNHIIRPDGWVIPQEATDVHGITNERAMAEGEPLAEVLTAFITNCYTAKLICGHNIYFDVSVIKSELMRDGAYTQFAEDALYKGKRIDTMRPSMKFVDARFSNGRLKFPRLEELYARCFPGETFPAHDAIEDVRAVVRCLPVLVDKGIITLAVKEYPTVQIDPAIAPNISEKAEKDARPQENAGNGPISATKDENDKLHVSTPKGSQNENSPKITDTNNDLVAAMLADDNF